MNDVPQEYEACILGALCIGEGKSYEGIERALDADQLHLDPNDLDDYIDTLIKAERMSSFGNYFYRTVEGSDRLMKLVGV
jgi:hypothetical protein